MCVYKVLNQLIQIEILVSNTKYLRLSKHIELERV